MFQQGLRSHAVVDITPNPNTEITYRYSTQLLMCCSLRHNSYVHIISIKEVLTKKSLLRTQNECICHKAMKIFYRFDNQSHVIQAI